MRLALRLFSVLIFALVLAPATQAITSNGTVEYVRADKSVGIGTRNPSQKLGVNGSITIPETTSSTTGILYKDSNYFLHDFHHPTGGGAVPTGRNTFVGISAGNFTMGSTATNVAEASYNTGVGYSVLLSNTTGYNNTAVGANSLNQNTTGHSNTAVGNNSLENNSSGNENTAVGYNSMNTNSTGSQNTSFGYSALYSNSSGSANNAIGRYALYNNSTGNGNAASGYRALLNNTTGNYNTAIGYQAGAYISGGVTANQTSTNGLYLGRDTKASADGVNNEIVIGFDATGIGANTVVIGNSNITTTSLRGSVGIGTDSPGDLLDVNGDATIAGTLTLNGTPIGSVEDFLLEGGNTKAANITAGTNDAYDLNLETNNSTRVAIKANGDVGIGTTNPGFKLDVAGTINGVSLIADTMTIASGSITDSSNSISFGDENLSTTGTLDVGATTVDSLSVSDASITNVNDIALDTISSDGSTIGISATTSIAVTPGSTFSVNLGDDGGDDFIVDSDYFVVEGDTGLVSVGYSTGVERFSVNGAVALSEMAAPTNTADFGKLYVKASDSSLYFQDDGGDEVLIGAAGGFNPLLDGGNTLAASLTAGTNDANDFNLETNNNTRIAIKANGDVGIGTTSPVALLDIAGTVNGVTFNADTLSLTGGSITDSSGGIDFDNETLTTTGAVDFGAATVDSLDVSDNSITNVNNIALDSISADTDSIAVTLGGGASDDFTVDTDVLVVKSSTDRVGIGTTSPTVDLDVAGTINGVTISVDTMTLSTGSIIDSSGTISFGNENLVSTGTADFGATTVDSLSVSDASITNVNNIALDTISSDGSTIGISATTSITVTPGSTFNLNLGNDFGDDLLINGETLVVEGDNSRVGIGLTAPPEILSVNGSLALAEIAAPSNTANFGKLYVKASDSSLYFQDDGGNEVLIGAAGGANPILDGGNTHAADITAGTNDAYDFNFETNDSTRMTIEANGDVGIGTTTPVALLDVAGTVNGVTFNADTLSLTGGSITDSSGGIDFDNETLTTTGAVDFGAATVDSLNLSENSITNVNNIALDSISADNNSIAVTLGGGLGDDFTVDTDVLVVKSDTDRVGIGTTSPTVDLDVAGTINGVTISADTMTLSTGSIIDSSGTIDFDNENLVSTGTADFGATTVDSLDLSEASISNVNNIALDTISSDGSTIAVSATTSISITPGTSLNVVLGTDAGDDLLVDTDTLVVEGDNNRVGIGTTSPVSELDVAGTINGQIINADTMIITGGSITDSSGGIDFNDETLTTTGAVNFGAATVDSLNLSSSDITAVDDIAVNSISSASGTTIAVTLGTDAGDDFRVNGSTLVVEGDNSRVGIGTVAPSYDLDVTGTSRSTVSHIVDTMTLATGSITDSSNAIDFGDENLSTTGTLSAGATTISSLNVSEGNISNAGQVALDSIIADDTNISISAGGSISASPGTSFNISLGTDGGDDFTVDTTTLVVEGDNNRVGIGTTAPAYSLDVSGSIRSSSTVIIDSMTISTGSITDTSNAIDFGDEDLSTTGTFSAGAGTLTSLDLTEGNITNGGAMSLDSISSDNNTLGISATTAITVTPGTTFEIALGSDIGDDLIVDTNTLVVESDDNQVGIGTSNPAQALDVVGNIRASNNLIVGDMTINNGSITDTGGTVDFDDENLTTTGLTTTGTIKITGGSPGSNKVLISDADGDGSWADISVTGAMSNLGDDTTPSLGGNLDVNGFTISNSAGASVDFNAENLVTTGTADFGATTVDSLDLSDANITNVDNIALNSLSPDGGTIQVNLGGGAGNDLIVDTNTLVVESDDNQVGIGTAAPSYLLDVAGIARATGSIIADTMTLTGGSITDSSGSIDFVNENLSTTGTLSAGNTTVTALAASNGDLTNVGDIELDSISANGAAINVTLGASAGDDFIIDTTTLVVEGDNNRVGIGTAAPSYALDIVGSTRTSSTMYVGNMTLSGGSITDSSGAIDFSNENLSTTGTFSSGAATVTSLNVAEGNISNVGQIALDSIVADGSAIAITASTSVTANVGTSFDVNLGTDAGDDFTVNGSTLVVEGDNSRVGIGTATPVYTLDIVGSTRTSSTLIVDTMTINGGDISDSSGTISFDNENLTTTGLTTTGTLKITGGSPGLNKVLVSDADGDASWEDVSVAGAMVNLSDDASPSLGGNLDVNGFTISNSGGADIDFNSENLVSTGTADFGATTVDSLSVSDSDITNVGNIALDSISADGTDITVTLGAGASLLVDTDSLVVDGDNNRVGIGTAAPAYALDVSGSTRTSGSLIAGTMTVAGGSITDTSTAISFGDENLSTTGTLSAGATTVTSLNASTGNISNVGEISLDSISADASAINVTLGGASGNDFIVDTTSLVVEGDTNRVGIGTASPSYTLDVTGTARATAGMIASTMTIGSGSITDSSTAIDFDDENLSTTGTLSAGATTVSSVNVSDGPITNVTNIALDTISSDDSTIAVSATTSITFNPGSTMSVNLGTDAGDDFVVDTTLLVVEGDDREVGIGTASPAYELDVVGTMRANGGVIAGSVTVDNGSITDSSGSIDFDDENLTTTGLTTTGTLKITGGSPGSNKILVSDADGDATWATIASVGAMQNLYDDASPELGGNLDVNGFTISNSAGTDIDFNAENLVSTGTASFGATTVTSLDVSENNIYNVGDIAVDTISANNNSITVSLGGAPGDDFIVDTTTLVVESDENQVGIGTATPAYALDVTGTTRATTSVIADTLTIAGGSITDSTNAISFGNEALTTTGTLSAGSTTVTALSVSDNNISNVGNIALDSISADGTDIAVTLGAGASLLVDSTSLVVDGDNNRVGIGNATPSYSLDVNGTARASSTIIANTMTIATGSITDSGGSISFGNETLTTTGAVNFGATTVDSLDASDAAITNVSNIALDTISSDAGTTVSVTLGTDDGDDFIVGNNNALVVEGNDDQVGIGTANPIHALDVTGTARATTSVIANTMTIATGSITDSGGSISFGNENLTTTGQTTTSALRVSGGSPGVGKVLISDATGIATWQDVSNGGAMKDLFDDTSPELGGNLDVNGFTISNSGGASIDFNAENLVTTGTADFGATTVDSLDVSGGNIADAGNIALDTMSPAGTAITINLGGAAGNDLIVDTTTLVVESDDNQVGIGTATPAYELDVTGTARATTSIISDTMTITGGLITDTSTAISFGDENLSTTGTLSAGATTVASLNASEGNLTNVGNIALDSLSPDTTNISMTLGAGNDFIIDTNNFVVNGDTGRVGIGTTTPGYELAVSGTAQASTSMIADTLTISGGLITDSSTAISFDDENLSTTGTLSAGATTVSSLNASSGNITNVNNIALESISAGTSAVNISLGGAAGNDFTVDTNVLVVESDDNQVGIGTASPAYALDVTGTARATTSIIAGTMTLNGGDITDTSGTIDFDDENLITTGLTTTGSFKLTGGSPGSNKVLLSDADGDASWGNITATGALTSLIEDTSPQLGNDLDTNNHNIINNNGTTINFVSENLLTTGTADFGATTVDSLDVSSSNITSVDNIELNSLSSAGSSIGVTLGAAPGNDFVVGTNFLVVEGDTGRVGIGTATPGAHALSVVGTAGLSTGTAWTNTSDIRLKDVHGSYEYGLEEISSLDVIRFNYKKNNPLNLPSDVDMVGFSAQEVQEVIPDAVKTRDDGYLELNVDPIHWAVVNAVKELKAITDSFIQQFSIIDDETEELRRINEEQNAEIAALKAIVCADHPEAEICQE